MPPYDGSPAKAHKSVVTQTLDPSRLAPEDAFYAHSPPRRQRARSPLGLDGAARGDKSEVTRRLSERRSSGRRRKSQWRKLLWVKQSYPDNYTDEYTFLEQLQRNPQLRPYEFWRLVADSTAIVQHVCSVAIFICCFTGIFQERVSPLVIVTWGTTGTVLGWGLWDSWVTKADEKEAAAKAEEVARRVTEGEDDDSISDSGLIMKERKTPSLELTRSPSEEPARNGHAVPTSPNGATFPISPSADNSSDGFATHEYDSMDEDHLPWVPSRAQQRLATIKSALLIYSALLGLSPILKSLTKSTTSDSIWAMSCWLLCINIFFFDYSSGAGAKFPASLSTNAALMASTVLASRLTSTTHVFSLTLFSIEVFGLFPVFRRHLRHVSWSGHIMLTILLVMGAGAGVGVTVSGGGWKAAIVGCVLGSILMVLAMGICSMWLIGLQKYKNEIHGPWDPARPIIRRRWD
ncbi:GPI2-domain-containing protein [Trichodelitschia bisporula]|uniref:GPI2-domain-containing protein n=1 Tax=Trichodelitschia bisporula TaxID=703511 RepID=A0A6G1HNW1_9PEZI|nr:GPI2-domain-containing protein [Trichodelitschia bisporula]